MVSNAICGNSIDDADIINHYDPATRTLFVTAKAAATCSADTVRQQIAAAVGKAQVKVSQMVPRDINFEVPHGNAAESPGSHGARLHRSRHPTTPFRGE
jgi:hypothetical protein